MRLTSCRVLIHHRIAATAIVAALVGCGDDGGAEADDAGGTTMGTAETDTDAGDDGDEGNEAGDGSTGGTDDGGDGADDTSGGAPTPADPNPGIGSQTLEAVLHVNVTAESGGSVQTELVATLEQPDDTAISDATVTVTFDGQSRVLAPDVDSPGIYRADVAGYAQAYEFDIERGADTLTDVVLVGPSIHDVALDPNPATVAQPATITWTPHSEPDVTVDIIVYQLPGGTTFSEPLTLDDGEHPLGPDAFPEAEEYRVRIDRATRRDLDAPASVGTVRLMIELPTQAVP